MFDPVAERLVAGRQLQRLTELRRVLVPVEAGFVGGDLEEHAAGGAEVDRPEVITVDHRRHLVTGVEQRVAHPKLGGI